MATYNERLDIYDKVFSFLLKMKIAAIPTPLANICKRLNIEIVPLSKILSGTRLSAKEIFEKVWHNKDGHLITYYENGKYKLKIAYNDGLVQNKLYNNIVEIICLKGVEHNGNRNIQ